MERVERPQTTAGPSLLHQFSTFSTPSSRFAYISRACSPVQLLEPFALCGDVRSGSKIRDADLVLRGGSSESHMRAARARDLSGRQSCRSPVEGGVDHHPARLHSRKSRPLGRLRQSQTSRRRMPRRSKCWMRSTIGRSRTRNQDTRSVPFGPPQHQTSPCRRRPRSPAGDVRASAKPGTQRRLPSRRSGKPAIGSPLHAAPTTPRWTGRRDHPRSGPTPTPCRSWCCQGKRVHVHMIGCKLHGDRCA